MTAVLGLAIAGCGSSDSSSDSTPSSSAGTPATSSAAATSSAPEPSKSDVKVGLAYDIGGRGDKSFNDAAAAGLDKAKKELGVEIQEVSPNAGGTDRGDKLTLLAEGGFNPIIAVGFAYADDVKTVAAAHPDTTFAIIDDSSITDLPNVESLVFAEQQGSFLVGAAAALKSKTGTIGYIGGVQTPLLQKFEAGYVAGARKVNPDIQVQVKYLTVPPDFDGFKSPDKGKVAAKGMFDNNADVVYAAAGGSGKGVFDAAVDAKGAGKDVLVIGVDSDQYQTASDAAKPLVLTSMVKRVDTAVFDTIEAATKGEKPSAAGTVKEFDLKNDGVGYATSNSAAISDITGKLDDLKSQIISGAITVPTKP